MVLWQLRDYARLGFRISFISAAPRIEPAAWAEICGIAEIALLRRNYGFDFGAWADALQVAWPAGETLEELLLMNDSVLGRCMPWTGALPACVPPARACSA